MSSETPLPPPPPRGPVAKRNGQTSRWRRRLPLIGAIVLVALIVIGLWPRPLAVEVAAVERGALVVTVDEEGMTRVRNRYVISAPVAGQLRRVELKAGATIEAGKTVLAVLETSGADFLDARSEAQAVARVRAAESARNMAAAQRERVRATQTLAESEWTRAQTLFEKGTLSRQEFDVAEMRHTSAAQEARTAEFALQVAEFELQQAQALLMRGTPGDAGSTEPLVIKAPVNGSVLRVMQESARVVPGGFPVLEVGDPTDLEVRIEVLSRDGVAITPGARVRLERWGGAEPLEARVRLVEPSAFTKISALGVEEQRVYVIADFVTPAEQRPTLGDNYRVEARIVTWEGQNVVWAPAGALFQRGDGWETFVFERGRARLRSVRVGRSNGLETEILEGLQEGERVIVFPGDQVADGKRVAAIEVAR